ncbi:MAG: endonuclease [Frankiales bacterium]|nr:endonuclease [Frankiales bacterium]
MAKPLAIRRGSVIIEHMSDLGQGSESGNAASLALAQLTAAVDALLVLDYPSLTEEELLELARLRERQVRRLTGVDGRALAEINTRGVAGSHGFRSSDWFLVDLLQISKRDAHDRLDAAERFAPRHGISGQPVCPTYPVIAAALEDGALSPVHAQIIVSTLQGLPAPVLAERGTEVEETLVRHAATSSPTKLRTLAARITAHLHPDGDLAEHRDRIQRADRNLSLFRQPDSTGDLLAHLSPACQAIWETVLTPLAAKRDPDALGEDRRTDGQRWHDAFEEAGRRLLATADLPDHAGLMTTLVVTMNLTDLEQRIGRATTHHGGTLAIDDALRLAAGQHVIPVVLGDGGQILAHGRKHRLATPAQRLALFARDRGCTFPDCAEPAARSQIHHIRDWAQGGMTDLDNLTVTCGLHNNEAPRQGWTATMINEVPHWTPPRWRDPDQQPLRNYQHHPELAHRYDPPPDG